MPVLLVRLVREKGFGERLKQMFGFIPTAALLPVMGKDCIWLHAASVGEIVATSPIVKEIRRELPECPILISVVTTNGYVMAHRIIPEADSIIYFPLDLFRLARRVIAQIRPRIFLPVETELWPNFLYAIRELNIPVLMVNGRISDKSVTRYRYLGSVLNDMLSTVGCFCMQSMIDSQYIISLGADPRRVVVTGNTKFDQTYTDVSAAEQQELYQQFGFSGRQPVIVAGSTHKGEEEMLFTAFIKVRELFPQAALVIAPREIMRTDELLSLAENYKLRAVRRSALDAGVHDVVIVDSIGELGRIYGMGDIIFVGGSLVSHGGHNILEPAAHGKPIIVGPHMFNFKDSYALLSDRGACSTVFDGTELSEKIIYILNHPEERTKMGDEALTIIREIEAPPGIAWST